MRAIQPSSEQQAGDLGGAERRAGQRRRLCEDDDDRIVEGCGRLVKTTRTKTSAERRGDAELRLDAGERGRPRRARADRKQARGQPIGGTRRRHRGAQRRALLRAVIEVDVRSRRLLGVASVVAVVGLRVSADADQDEARRRDVRVGQQLGQLLDPIHAAGSELHDEHDLVDGACERQRVDDGGERRRVDHDDVGDLLRLVDELLCGRQRQQLRAAAAGLLGQQQCEVLVPDRAVTRLSSRVASPVSTLVTPTSTLIPNALPIVGRRRSPSIRITRLWVRARDVASEIAEVVLPSPGPGLVIRIEVAPAELLRDPVSTARRVRYASIEPRRRLFQSNGWSLAARSWGTRARIGSRYWARI